MKNAFPLLLLLVLAVPKSQAQPGSLDPTFGVGGKLVTTLPNASEFVVLPDGKLLALGSINVEDSKDIAVYRLHANGAPDSTFGIHGRATIDFNVASDLYYRYDKESSILVLDNGDIMIAGTYINSFVGVPDKIGLARLQADGMPDEDFGNAGQLLFEFDGFSAHARQLRKYSNGDFLLWGAMEADTASAISHIVLIRFKANGDLDPFFGPAGNGVLIKPIGPASPFLGITPPTLRIAPDEKIVLAGTYTNGFSVSRYNADGSDDLTFGTNGQVVIADLFFAQVGSMAVQLDGKILTAGDSYDNGDPRFTLVRQNADGSLDSSFGDNGMVFNDVATYGCYINSLALQEDGKAVVVGRGEFALGSRWIVARYQANGALDAGFGTNGLVITNFENGDGAAYDVVIDAQHAIYVAGSARRLGPGQIPPRHLYGY